MEGRSGGREREMEGRSNEGGKGDGGEKRGKEREVRGGGR